MESNEKKGEDVDLFLEIKRFLSKIKTFELKTEAGKTNTIIGLVLLVLFGFLAIETSIKEFLWQHCFGREGRNHLVLFLILMFCFLCFSMLLVYLSEKEDKKIPNKKRKRRGVSAA